MAVSLWLLVSFLVVLLALPVAVVIAAWAHWTRRAEFRRSSLPRTDNPPAEGAHAEPDLPEPAPGPPASPMPRRVAGLFGVAYPAGDPADPPRVIRPPQVSGSPPWGPAPKPPGVPERIKRLGWDKAAGERRSQGPGRTLTLTARPEPHPYLQPRWTPHARFHDASAVVTELGWSIASLWLLWRRGTRDQRELALKIAALHPVLAYAPFFIAEAVPGADAEDEPGKLPRVAGVPGNLFGAGVCSGLSALGYLLARGEDRISR